MTTNIFQTGMDVAQGMQGLRDQRYLSDEKRIKDQMATEARQAQAQSMEQLNAMKQQYADSGDPEVMRQIIMADPEFAGKLQEQFQLLDESRNTQVVNQAGALKAMIDDNPEQAAQFWQENLSQDPAFSGLADNFQAGDYEGALNEIGWGVTLSGGQTAYDSLFGTTDKTDFASDLIAAGIEPGSQEFKDAVLEKYGKGDTIGYDVIEALNPETGRREYYQVSRVNPDEKVPLGLEVPMSAAEIKALKADQDRQASEKETIENTLATVGKILSSPGLSGFSGLDQVRKYWPGSEAANVNAYIDQLQSQNFMTSINQMKGMGSLSDAEGRKVAAAVAAISPMMSDEAILKEIKAIEENLLIALERIESGELVNPDGTPRSGDYTDPEEPVSWGDLP